MSKDYAIAREGLSITAQSGISEVVGYKTKWQIEKFDKDMNKYDTETIDGNLMLTTGVTLLWTILTGGAGTKFDNANAHIGVGDSNTAVAEGQTTLLGSNKTYVGMDSTYPQVDNRTIVARATFPPGTGTHDWLEFALTNGDSGASVHLNRKVEGTARTKPAADTWIVQLSITITTA